MQREYHNIVKDVDELHLLIYYLKKVLTSGRVEASSVGLCRR